MQAAISPGRRQLLKAGALTLATPVFPLLHDVPTHELPLDAH